MPPLAQATIVEHFQLIGNDKRNDAVGQTFLEHQQTAVRSEMPYFSANCETEIYFIFFYVIGKLFFLFLMQRYVFLPIPARKRLPFNTFYAFFDLFAPPALPPRCQQHRSHRARLAPASHPPHVRGCPHQSQRLRGHESSRVASSTFVN